MRKLGLGNTITEIIKVGQAYTSLYPEVCLGLKSISLHHSAPYHLLCLYYFLLHVTSSGKPARGHGWSHSGLLGGLRSLALYLHFSDFVPSNLDLWGTAFSWLDWKYELNPTLGQALSWAVHMLPWPSLQPSDMGTVVIITSQRTEQTQRG